MRNSVRQLSWFKRASDYFPCRLVKTVDLEATRNYLFCAHPHGIASYGIGLSFGSEALNFSTTFPGLRTRLMTLSLFFKLPIMREHLLALGMCSSSVKCLKYVLNNEGACSQKGQVKHLRFKIFSQRLFLLHY